MSTWFDEEVRCPQCPSRFTARLAHGVHISRAPEVRDQVFARTFHRTVCPACGFTFTAERPVIYTDMERKHWVQVALPIERPRWPELEPVADDVFARAFLGSPLAAELRGGFKRRLVFGLEELREKLVIWRAALDDATVECAKLHAISRDPELARAALVVDEVVGGALRIAVSGEHGGEPRRIELAAGLVEQLHDDARLAERFPELFGGRFVSVHRLLGHRYKAVAPG